MGVESRWKATIHDCKQSAKFTILMYIDNNKRILEPLFLVNDKITEKIHTIAA